MKKKLNELREQIDKLDNEIFSLLIKRFNIIDDIKEYKLENNIQISDSSRENEIKERITNLINDSKNNKYYLDILNTILKTSKEYQKRD